MDKIRIVTLGGLDELYKNMTVVEINNDIFVIECGVKFPDKTKPGIDYIIPRYDYLFQNKDKVRGYFLTHGHDSIIGALPYIYEKVPAPIYCSKTTSLFLRGFCKHNHLDFSKYNVITVKTDEDLVICNRKISLFGTASNFAESFGVSISTDQGNIIYLSNFVIHNNLDLGFIDDTVKLSRICDNNKTLVLLMDATNAELSGYCSPHYQLIPLIKKDLFDLKGRIFLAIDAPDLFNIVDTLSWALKLNKKIIPYDDQSKEIISALSESGFLTLQRDSLASIEEVNRIKPDEVVVFMTGYGSKLNSKIALLASKNNDDRIVFLNPTDTFIFANHVTPENEISCTDALDELYHNDCKIIKPNSKEFIRMHGCEEDIKSMIAFIRPKYFVPVSGSFKQLLAAAKIALNMHVGLNHNNVFIVDNGNIIEFETGIGRPLPNKIIVGDLMIDGKGVGDIESSVIEERQKFSDDGVIILGATISKSERKIVAGPDIQARGLVFLKDSESLIKELTRLFVTTINTELAKENYSIAYIQESVKDIIFKDIRRVLNKTPIIIPIIAEIE